MPSGKLAVRNEVVGPHGRLGLAWALATLVAVVAGPVWLALWLVPLAGVAALQAARSWRSRDRSPRRRPVPAVAGAGAAVLPAAAALGPVPTAVAAAAVAVGCFSATLARRFRQHGAHVGLTVLIALWMGLAAACPVILRTDGLITALVLLAYAAAYDTGAYLVGTEAASAWEGPAAGIAAVGAATLAVAAFLVPPFTGATPWVLGGVAAVSAPLGPLAGNALLGDRRARVPFVRRLDSLLVMGPAWTLAVTQLVD